MTVTDAIELDVHPEQVWTFDFAVHAPWGFVGWILPTIEDNRPLARPVGVWPIWLAVWLADAAMTRDDNNPEVVGTAAVSSKAAQLQLLRHTGATTAPAGELAQAGMTPRPRVAEPTWGGEVRDLNGEELVEAAKAAGWAKAAGRDVGETVLTPWEIENLEPVLNPVARRFDALAREDRDRAEEWLLSHEAVQLRPRTPPGLRLHAARNGQARWFLADAARYLGVETSTVESWRSRERFPREDGMAAHRPWWHAATVRRWNEQRPGRGARTDLTDW